MAQRNLITRLAVASAASAALLFAGVLPAATYGPGFVWDRSVDYDAGTVHGLTLGNPNTDSQGVGVWRMESTNGGGDPLGGANPWYQDDTTIQVWDNSWYGGGGVWARGDNVNPPMGQDSITMNVSNTGLRGTAPLVRWINPVHAGVELEITGELTVNWRGGGGQSGNVDFDVVIAHVDKQNGTTSVLFGETFEKPHDDTTWESLSMPVDLLADGIGEGDEIIISAWGLGTSSSTWPNLADDLSFELTAVVPEPATMGLLALAAGALGGYIRRRRS